MSIYQMKGSEKSSKKKFKQVNPDDSLNKRTEKAMVLETPYGEIVIHLYYNTITIVRDVVKRALLGNYSGITFCNRNSSFIQMIKHPNEEKTNLNPISLRIKNSRGTVGLVNSKKGPRAVLINDFYICFKDIKDFDEDGTIIGKVIKGMNLIKKINNGFQVKRVRIINIQKSNNMLLKVFFGIGILFSLPYLIALLPNIFGFMKDTSFIKILSSQVSAYMAIIGALLMLITLILGLVFRGKLSGYEEEKSIVSLEKPTYEQTPAQKPSENHISKEPIVPDIKKIGAKFNQPRKEKSKEIKGKKDSFKSPKKEKMEKPKIEEVREEPEIEDIKPKEMPEKEEEKEIESKTEPNIRIESSTKNSTETNLDSLYNMLEEKNTLKIDSLTKTFKVSKKELLEWCNILAEHGLAEINYPTFRGPVLKKKEKDKVTS